MATFFEGGVQWNNNKKKKLNLDLSVLFGTALTFAQQDHTHCKFKKNKKLLKLML